MPELKQTYELTELVLQSQQKMIERADIKGQGILTLLTLVNVIAIVFIVPQTLKLNESFPKWTQILFLLVIICFFLDFIYCVWIILRVMEPKIMHSPGVSGGAETSVRFYRGIIAQDYESYKRKMMETDLESFVNDNIQQIYILSEIIEFKYSELSRIKSYIIILLTLISTLIFLTLALNVILK